MKKLIISIVLVLVFISGYAFAQYSTATQIVLGYNQITSPYWAQYTTANPLPIGVQ